MISVLFNKVDHLSDETLKWWFGCGLRVQQPQATQQRLNAADWLNLNPNIPLLNQIPDWFRHG